jgi:hypothetical protein
VPGRSKQRPYKPGTVPGDKPARGASGDLYFFVTFAAPRAAVAC